MWYVMRPRLNTLWTSCPETSAKNSCPPPSLPRMLNLIFSSHKRKQILKHSRGLRPPSLKMGNHVSSKSAKTRLKTPYQIFQMDTKLELDFCTHSVNYLFQFVFEWKNQQTVLKTTPKPPCWTYRQC